MRLSALTTSFLALLLCSSADATSFRCADTNLDARAWVEKYFELADVVLLGTVISSEAPKHEEYIAMREAQSAKKAPAATMQELLERIEEAGAEPIDYSMWPYASVSFEVRKRWKGPPFRVFSAKFNISGGGGPLPIGGTYLVFAYEQEENVYTVATRCKSTIDAEDAVDRIEVLNEIAYQVPGEEDEW